MSDATTLVKPVAPLLSDPVAIALFGAVLVVSFFARKTIASIFNDTLTGPDNKTFDLVRVWTAVGAATGIVLQVYVVLVNRQPFDFQGFGIGLGLVIGAGAAGMWARKDIEVPTTAVPPVKEGGQS